MPIVPVRSKRIFGICKNSLYSYGGEALDKKTALLRFMETLNSQALRILRLLDDESAQTVRAIVGPEQEYFLIDAALYEKRPDLQYTQAARSLVRVRPKGRSWTITFSAASSRAYRLSCGSLARALEAGDLSENRA